MAEWSNALGLGLSALVATQVRTLPLAYKVEKMDILNRIKKISLKEIIEIEKKDPQFISLKKLKNKNDLSKEVVGAALICYQLSGTGELFWEEFANFFIKGNDLKKFLFSSKTSKRLRNVKLKRLKKYEKIKDKISLNLSFLDLLEILERGGFKKNKKTTSFAIKMFGYYKRIKTNKFQKFPMEIPIPVDSRIKKLTPSKNPMKFWNDVSKQINIPPLHIDSVLWNWKNL